MKKLLYILFLFLFGNLFSQEESQFWTFKENLTINGYVKYLPSYSFSKGSYSFINHLLHNRINIKAFLGEKFMINLGIRNRIFVGDFVKKTPNYGKNIAVDDGQFDLSFLLINSKTLVAHTIFDRASLDFANKNWQISIGRQRINWGINFAWNTNDLFNAYNIINFDYEEKAGSDAIRVQHYFTNTTLDVAYKLGNGLDNSVIAVLYKFNKHKYDFQFLVANYYNDIAVGTGWAGNIKSAGFKGEATFFSNKKTHKKVTSISASIDYFFKQGMYINTSILYTSNGESTFNPLVLNFTTSTLSAKKLMPTKYSYLVQVANEFSPRFKANITTIYGAGMDILFVMPSLDYALKENWDVNLTGQFFYAQQQNSFKNINNSIFLRLQYSY